MAAPKGVPLVGAIVLECEPCIQFVALAYALRVPEMPYETSPYLRRCCNVPPLWVVTVSMRLGLSLSCWFHRSDCVYEAKPTLRRQRSTIPNSSTALHRERNRFAS